MWLGGLLTPWNVGGVSLSSAEDRGCVRAARLPGRPALEGIRCGVRLGRDQAEGGVRLGNGGTVRELSGLFGS